jgi:hypothetical protein
LPPRQFAWLDCHPSMTAINVAAAAPDDYAGSCHKQLSGHLLTVSHFARFSMFFYGRQMEIAMAEKMKAAVVHRFGQPLLIEEVDDPAVPFGQILVKIVASGICHTDLHAAQGDWPV